MALPKGLLGTLQSLPLSQIPLNPHGGRFPPRNHVSGFPFLLRKRPLPSRNPNPDPGVPKWVPGSKISKLRTEKPCRIQWSVFQTEPYVASYGRNHFGPGGMNNGGERGPEGDVSADKTSVVSADKTSVVSHDIPPTFSTEGRPRC